jgi:hypothetical protein
MSQDETDTPSDETETHEDPSFGEPTLRDTSLPEATSKKSREERPTARQGPDWARSPEDASLKGVLEALLKNQGLLMDLISQTSILDGLERESIETREAIRRVEEDGTYVQGLISQMTVSTEDLNQVVERLGATRRRLEDKLEPTVDELSAVAGDLRRTNTSLKTTEGAFSKAVGSMEKAIPVLEKLGWKMNWQWTQRVIATAVGLFLVALAGFVYLTPMVQSWAMDTETKIEMLPANIENKIHNYDRHLNRYNSLDAPTQKMVGEAMGWKVPDVAGDKGEDAPGK